MNQPLQISYQRLLRQSPTYSLLIKMEETSSQRFYAGRLVGKFSRRLLQALFVSVYATSSCAFTSPIFQEAVTLQRTMPSKTYGVEIELPDFDEMFGRIQAVSPLARLAISGAGSGVGGGFEAVDDCGKEGILLLISVFHCMVCENVLKLVHKNHFSRS